MTLITYKKYILNFSTRPLLLSLIDKPSSKRNFITKQLIIGKYKNYHILNDFIKLGCDRTINKEVTKVIYFIEY